MQPDLSQSTTAYSVSLSHINDLLQGRIFDVASREQIDTTGKEVFELVSSSRDVPRSLIVAAQMLFKGATRNTERSRSLSFVAEEVYFRLGYHDKEVACDFRYELENLAVGEFTRVWKEATESSIKSGLHRDEPSLSSVRVAPEYLETYDRIRDLSIVLSDFYAMGFISPRAFKKVVEVIAERFDQRDYLIYLIIMLSRANSHRGKPFSHTWYLDLVWQIRTRCTNFFDDREPKEEESCLTRLVRGLIKDLNGHGESSRYCKIPVSYYVIEEWDTEMMIGKARDEIDELYLLDTRPPPLNDPDSDCPGSPPPAITSVNHTQETGNSEPALYDSPEEEEVEEEDVNLTAEKNPSISCPTPPRRRTRKRTEAVDRPLSPLSLSLASSKFERTSGSLYPVSHLQELGRSSGPNVDCRRTPSQQSGSASSREPESMRTAEDFKPNSELAATPLAPRRRFNSQNANLARTKASPRPPVRGIAGSRQSEYPPKLAKSKSQRPRAELRLSDLTTTSELERATSMSETRELSYRSRAGTSRANKE